MDARAPETALPALEVSLDPGERLGG